MRVIAFDCFGTVFDASTLTREDISAYVNHVRKNNFTPFSFGDSWWALKLHPDAAEGIRLLQRNYKCVALSNGSVDLLEHVSEQGGITWDYIVDLVDHGVYKPHQDAYRTIEKDLGVAPADTMMVTANPTFGDVEGAQAIGMQTQVIRHGYPNTIIELAEMLKGGE